jgi:hypothetical protein
LFCSFSNEQNERIKRNSFAGAFHDERERENDRHHRRHRPSSSRSLSFYSFPYVYIFKLTNVRLLIYEHRHSSVYNSQPPPDEDDNFWGWLTGEESGGRRVPASSANYATGITEDEDTFNWLDEEGDEIEEEDDSVRGDGHVVAGGATLNASRRGKIKDEKPKMKPKKKKTPRELEEEDDPLGGFLELLGLEDEEEEEYVRRDSKKDK